MFRKISFDNKIIVVIKMLLKIEYEVIKNKTMDIFFQTSKIQ